MAVEWEIRQLAHRLDHLRSEGDVRDELSIHDVDMNPVSTARLAHRNFVGETSEIGGENARRDAGRRCVRRHGRPPTPTWSVILAPAVTCAPAAGDWDTTRAPPSGWPPLGAVTSPIARPSCVRSWRACAKLRPTTSGTWTVLGPALSTRPIGPGIGVSVPGRGRVSTTSPRAVWLGCSLTSPTSNPAWSST